MTIDLNALPTEIPKPADFKKIRLRQSHRDELFALANQTLVTAAEEAAEAEAHAACLKAVRHALNLAITAADLEVLRRFKATSEVFVVEIQGGYDQYGNHRSVEFPVLLRDVRRMARINWSDPTSVVKAAATGDFMEVPRLWGRYNNCPLPGLDAPEIGFKELRQSWFVAATATNAARNAILTPLKATIDRARTLQDVAEVWPEAMRLAPWFDASSRVPTPADENAAKIEESEGRIKIRQATWIGPREITGPTGPRPVADAEEVEAEEVGPPTLRVVE